MEELKMFCTPPPTSTVGISIMLIVIVGALALFLILMLPNAVRTLGVTLYEAKLARQIVRMRFQRNQASLIERGLSSLEAEIYQAIHSGLDGRELEPARVRQTMRATHEVMIVLQKRLLDEEEK